MPIVLLSGKDGFFERARATAAGADGLLAKPFDPPQLLDWIRSAVPAA